MKNILWIRLLISGEKQCGPSCYRPHLETNKTELTIFQHPKPNGTLRNERDLGKCSMTKAREKLSLIHI